MGTVALRTLTQSRPLSAFGMTGSTLFGKEAQWLFIQRVLQDFNGRNQPDRAGGWLRDSMQGIVSATPSQP